MLHHLLSRHSYPPTALFSRADFLLPTPLNLPLHHFPTKCPSSSLYLSPFFHPFYLPPWLFLPSAFMAICVLSLSIYLYLPLTHSPMFSLHLPLHHFPTKWTLEADSGSLKHGHNSSHITTKTSQNRHKQSNPKTLSYISSAKFKTLTTPSNPDPKNIRK